MATAASDCSTSTSKLSHYIAEHSMLRLIQEFSIKTKNLESPCNILGRDKMGTHLSSRGFRTSLKDHFLISLSFPSKGSNHLKHVICDKNYTSQQSAIEIFLKAPFCLNLVPSAYQMMQYCSTFLVFINSCSHQWHLNYTELYQIP